MLQRPGHSSTAWWIVGTICAVLAVVVTIAGLKYHRTRSAIAEIEANGYEVMYYEYRPEWLQFLVGNRITDWLSSPGVLVRRSRVSTNPDRHAIERILARLPDLGPVIHVSIVSHHIVDGDLAILGRLPRLDHLNLAQTAITGQGMVHLQKLKALQSLDLSDTAHLTDDGLRALGTMKQLTSLSLDGATITDENLLHLTTLTNLRRLSLSNTGVSESAIEKLREAIPDLEVTDD